MQGCQNDTGKLIGKVAVLRMAYGCADTVPALSEWKRLGYDHKRLRLLHEHRQLRS